MAWMSPSTVRLRTNRNMLRPYLISLSRNEEETMGITIVALLLFIALVVCWVALPGSVAVTEAAHEAEPVVRGTMQRAA